MATPEARIVDLDSRPSILQADRPQAMQRLWVWLSVLIFVFGFFYLNQAVSFDNALLFLVAGVLGVALYHAHFGFTSSFRHLIVSGRGVGIRAQMIAFALTNVLFLPVLQSGHVLGHAVKANVYPVGLSVLVGSILFGVGMQLGDGCASGTLYHTGGGDVRGILTLVGFVVGSVIGSAHYAWWMKTPNIGPVSFVQTLGPVGGLLTSLVLMAVVFAVVWLIEKRRNGRVEPLFGHGGFQWAQVIRGPWSWVAGGVVLAVGNFILLLVSGKPWGVTSAFALWGAKIAQGLGIQVQQWGYWQTAANAHALHQSVLTNLETTDDIAIMLGALLAAALAGKLPQRYFRGIPARMVIGLLVGGILMGYGARIAFGCNIGAYFSGIASFSLHGWEWFLGALIGSAIGVRLRPVCSLRNR
ncbi:YeeE/YedE family protein [Alicyclobacillus sp.]|uniref:YeeE/YedE family protein n=1 Tax=Alicyclobacillus sp. TaxID=61169 RepID=UPI0025C1B7DC|nr:YeeE/YedE family protein [Alicyclobacillus sp.]MCL6518012.1 YeeE/YedE family protein [Alicyclobacillus sp.]